MKQFYGERPRLFSTPFRFLLLRYAEDAKIHDGIIVGSIGKKDNKLNIVKDLVKNVHKKNISTFFNGLLNIEDCYFKHKNYMTLIKNIY